MVESIAAMHSRRSPQASPRFDVIALNAPFGAEVLGLSLDTELPDAEIALLRTALNAYRVLMFRDLRMTPAQHVAFSRRFGPLQVHVLNQFQLSEHPEILIVSNVLENGKPIGLGDAGIDWHSDLSYMPLPSLGSLLHAQEVPNGVGDTSFADMVQAYATLPAEVKRTLADRRAVHSYVYRYERLRRVSPWRPPLTAEQIARVPEVTHPVVRTHPETGSKALFVNEGFTARIEGLPEDESRSLLDALFAHSVRAENIYTHHWRQHDLVFWDNRAVTHYAPPCPVEWPRTLYRTTIEGDMPV